MMKKAAIERFSILCQKEPRLRALYDRARAVRDDTSKPSFCANNVWVNALKPQLLETCRLGCQESGPCHLRSL